MVSPNLAKGRYSVCMLRVFALVSLISAAVVAGDGDPSGTVSLKMEVGKSVAVPAAAGASVICDDTTVVTSQFSADGDGYELLALKPGSTLCGVWLPGKTPGGLYRVTVVSKTN
jgi:hypothetical protein